MQLVSSHFRPRPGGKRVSNIVGVVSVCDDGPERPPMQSSDRTGAADSSADTKAGSAALGSSEPDGAERRAPIPCDEDAGVYLVGCVARVSKLSHARHGKEDRYTLLVEGLGRFRILHFVQRTPYLLARATVLSDSPAGMSIADEVKAKAVHLSLQRSGRELVEALRSNAGAAVESHTLDMIDDNAKRAEPSKLAYTFTSVCSVPVRDRQRVLEANTLLERLEAASYVVAAQIEILRLSKDIHRKVNQNVKDSQRRFYLRQQMQAIRKELGEDDDGEEDTEDTLAELEKRLLAAHLPDSAAKVVKKELKRARRLNPMLPEHSVLISYLEWMADLPWSSSSRERRELSAAREQLDADHFGLDKVKKRVLEFLSVRQLNPAAPGPILCLVGPPGVGKTSLGRSIAAALGRKFCRLALGGVRDEAEIRGHRRTYIGALPGKIIQTLKRVGTNNPVILLDEVDKLGNDFRGDPSAALLEVLDPEQNNSFTDHYIGVPFDLSRVMFIATANELEPISPPLLDRMEVIRLPGYTAREKRHIASRHLLPKQFEAHSLTPRHLSIPNETIEDIIERYTSEAGVRSLEKQLAAVCRHTAVQLAEWRHPKPFIPAPTFDGPKPRYTYREGPEGVGYYVDSDFFLGDVSDDCFDGDPAIIAEEDEGDEAGSGAAASRPDAAEQLSGAEGAGGAGGAADDADPRDADFKQIVVKPDMLRDILGVERYDHETADRGIDGPGIATGMAWTSAGGELLFVEASRMAGTGRLVLTGQLGDVMKESAKTALSWIRSHALDLGLEPNPIANFDIHVHFPAGAVPKDGPSAGVAVTSALISMLTGRVVRADTAMTGEVTLRGAVMPVGGIKEKVLGAHRGGIRRVILPLKNSKDVDDVPSEVRRDMEIILVDSIDNLLELVFQDGPLAATPSFAQPRAGAGPSAVSAAPGDHAVPLLASKL